MAKTNTSLPLIEYTVDTVTPEYSKNEWEGDDVNFSILCTSTTYSSVNDLAGEVRNALELEAGLNGGITTQRILMEGFTEDYDLDGDSFIMNLRFNTKVTIYT